MKKAYETPVIEKLVFDRTCVIATSLDNPEPTALTGPNATKEKTCSVPATKNSERKCTLWPIGD